MKELMESECETERLNETQPLGFGDIVPHRNSYSTSSDENAFGWLDTVPSLPFQRFALSDDLIVCGRMEMPDIQIQLQKVVGWPKWGESISKRHFQITRDREAEVTFICDISSNGTFVNGKRIERETNTILKNGDVISICYNSYDVFVYNEQPVDNYPKDLKDKYVLTSVDLGRGSYSKVVLARLSQDAGRCFAIKCLDKRKTLLQPSIFTAKIKREVDFMKRLQHANIVQVFEYVESDEMACIVLEYASGGELFDRIVDPANNNLGLGDYRGKYYAYQLLSALCYLHDKGICHRDIKPENTLLLTKDDFTVVKLSDFGLAKRDESEMKTYCGTQAYIAPEMMEPNCGPYENKVDIWSLGALLFTMFVGYPAFSEEYGEPVVEQVKKGKLRLLWRWKTVSRAAQIGVVLMLRVNPKIRPAARELLGYPWMLGPEAKHARRVIEKYERGCL